MSQPRSGGNPEIASRAAASSVPQLLREPHAAGEPAAHADDRDRLASAAARDRAAAGRPRRLAQQPGRRCVASAAGVG